MASSAVSSFNVEDALRQLLLNYQSQLANNAAQQQRIVLNRGQALGDSNRQFGRMFERVPTQYSRRGLETSGIKNQGVDRILGDQFRNLGRIDQGFADQANRLGLSDLGASFTYAGGSGDRLASSAVDRQSLASQLRDMR